MYITLYLDMQTGKFGTVKPNLENRHVHELRLAHTSDIAFIVGQLQAAIGSANPSQPTSNDVVRILIDIPTY